MMICRNYIDGSWQDIGDRELKNVINPADNTVVSQAVMSTVEDTEKAIQAAKKSFYVTREWRDMGAGQRASILFAVADKIDERLDEIAKLEMDNTGKPLREAETDVSDAANCFRYYAGMIDKPCGGVQDCGTDFGKMLSLTTQEPIGVVGAIGPWNYPIVTAVWKLAPCLAAGNSVIFNPSSTTPMSMVSLYEVFEEAGIPAGVANLVFGPGKVVGETFSTSKDIDMISFTGSTVVGQGIMRKAADNVKKLSLELGGKNPNIVFADAEMESVVEWTMMGGFFNAGQVCSAGSRVLVEECFHDAFVEKLVEGTKTMTQGLPSDNPDIGPMVTEEHMNKVLDFINVAKKQGGKIIVGGERNTEGKCAKGFYIKPTIIDNCNESMEIIQKEHFGPIITIETFKTEQEAIEKANNTEYGLAAGVFTKDMARALTVISEVRAGITWINHFNAPFVQSPWGGYKMSGIGRDCGEEGLREYQETKQINMSMEYIVPGWYSMK